MTSLSTEEVENSKALAGDVEATGYITTMAYHRKVASCASGRELTGVSLGQKVIRVRRQLCWNSHGQGT